MFRHQGLQSIALRYPLCFTFHLQSLLVASLQIWAFLDPPQVHFGRFVFNLNSFATAFPFNLASLSNLVLIDQMLTTAPIREIFNESSAFMKWD
jgi:hypothetical protein